MISLLVSPSGLTWLSVQKADKSGVIGSSIHGQIIGDFLIHFRLCAVSGLEAFVNFFIGEGIGIMVQGSDLVTLEVT